MRSASPLLLGLALLVPSPSSADDPPAAEPSRPPEAAPPAQAAPTEPAGPEVEAGAEVEAEPDPRPGPDVEVRRRAARRLPTPPPCNHRHRDQRRGRRAAPPARSMPELFSRMGQRMATNPAGAFQGMIEEMSRMEEPAMRDIRLGADEERAIGRRAREEYLRRAEARGWSVDRDPDRLRYMQDLVDTIAPLMSHRDRYPEVEVTLVEAPIPDGQCFPGGYLVFTTAMLDEPDEATVIAVVAHELAHLDLGHVYEYARRSKLAEATFTAPQAPGPAAFDQFFTRGMALFGLMMNPYRPEHESEADCLATTWLYLRGYDPEALVRFLERMHDRLRDQPDQAVPFLPFGRSHPFTLDRRRDVAQRLAQLQRWRARDDLGLFPDNLRTLRSRLRVHAEGR